MTLILPDPLAIGASKLNHVKMIAINTIYQNLSRVTLDRYVIFELQVRYHRLTTITSKNDNYHNKRVMRASANFSFFDEYGKRQVSYTIFANTRNIESVYI